MHLLCTCVLSFSLLMPSSLVSASVSTSFRDCSHFFYMQTPPAGMKGTSLRRICQKYADKLRYATLYDSSRRLPLYSAYIFKKSDGKRRVDTPWMYEPQVERTALMYLHYLPVLSLWEAECLGATWFVVHSCLYFTLTLNLEKGLQKKQAEKAVYGLAATLPVTEGRIL